jgi:hypothetical protein
MLLAWRNFRPPERIARSSVGRRSAAPNITSDKRLYRKEQFADYTAVIA